MLFLIKDFLKWSKLKKICSNYSIFKSNNKQVRLFVNENKALQFPYNLMLSTLQPPNRIPTTILSLLIPPELKIILPGKKYL